MSGSFAGGGTNISRACSVIIPKYDNKINKLTLMNFHFGNAGNMFDGVTATGLAVPCT